MKLKLPTSGLQPAKYGWYILPSPLTCCPGLTAMSRVGVTSAIGPSLGYPCGTQSDTGYEYVLPRNGTGRVPARWSRRDDWPFSNACNSQCVTR